MLLTVKNALGENVTVVSSGQESPTDASGIATGASQALFNANANRSGWFVQNRGASPMYVNELGAVATDVISGGAGCFKIAPGESFPPAGFPVTTSQINIIGIAGEEFVAREW